MKNIFAYIIIPVLGVGTLIILIVIAIQLNSVSKKSLTYSDLDLLMDNLIESGVVNKDFNTDDPLLKRRQIIISSYINENLAANVAARLLFLDSISHDSIYIIISSNGGWGICAKLITETFRLIKSPVNTVAAGTCYSSASLILVSGTGRRYATENSLFMVHANLSVPENNKSDNRYYNEWYEGIWKKSAALPPEWYPMTKDQEYYFNAEEAIRYKVIDEVIGKL